MKKVLVIEDDRDIQELLSLHLQDLDCIVALANAGDLGLKMACAHEYDLIVLDIVLPVIDGLQVCSQIRMAGVLTPILMLTGKAGEFDKVQGFETGADDYLTKPFSILEFIARVKAIFRRTQLAALQTKEVAPPILSMEAKFLEKIKVLVESNISNANFSIRQMAEELHLSRTQLFRKIKSVTNLSPNEYINDVRLRRAAQLILAKADTLAQICYAVGFNEQSYFAKRFRKKFGVTPKKYMQKWNDVQTLESIVGSGGASE